MACCARRRGSRTSGERADAWVASWNPERNQGHLLHRWNAHDGWHGPMAGFVPDYDSAVVERLKAAGAIILGKTTTTEFALLAPRPTRPLRGPSRALQNGSSSKLRRTELAVGTTPSLAVNTDRRTMNLQRRDRIARLSACADDLYYSQSPRSHVSRTRELDSPQSTCACSPGAIGLDGRSAIVTANGAPA